MHLKVRWLALGLVFCHVGVLAAGPAAGDAHEGSTASARESLYQAVEATRKGETEKLNAITDHLERKDGNYLSTELLPDYIALLKDKDGQVQMLAVQALGLLKFCQIIKDDDVTNMAPFILKTGDIYKQ